MEDVIHTRRPPPQPTADLGAAADRLSALGPPRLSNTKSLGTFR